MTKLLAGEQRIDTHGHGPDMIMTSREWASDIIREVSVQCDYGSYPQSIEPFDLGRALGRALANCNANDSNEHVNAYQVFKGIHHYLQRKTSNDK